MTPAFMWIFLGGFLAIMPVVANAQSNDAIYFKGNNTIVLKILNPYDGSQWQTVESYTTQGFRIMSILQSSQLQPDPNNPSLILVVMQKFN